MRQTIVAAGSALGLLAAAALLLPGCDEANIVVYGDASQDSHSVDLTSKDAGLDAPRDTSVSDADTDGGTTDDGLSDAGCQGDASRTCYSGAAGTKGVGLCQAGTQLCVAGKWGECSGEVIPKAEVCDSKDNDCNGVIDDSLSKPCYSGAPGTQGVGPCVAGVTICLHGKWGECNGEVIPSTETCDNKDNDCDGSTDELLTQSCYSGTSGTQAVGECKAGSETCSAGAWGKCTGEVIPTAEACDNKDNDCDGKTDESLSQYCYTGASGTKDVGLCKGGVQLCAAGKWDKCAGEVTPTVEVCDNKDNDCDGKTDESLSKSCYSGSAGTKGVGLCQAGTASCAKGAWSTCNGEVTPAAEACDNKDNDCDGKVDESLNKYYYDGPAGTKGVGLCQAGVKLCSSGSWGSCVGQVKPSTEICDNKDNDCDGNTDETWTNCGTSTYTGVYQCSGSTLQQQYIERGCSGGQCYTNNSWKTSQSCGSGDYNNCGSWSYYCSGNTRKRKRTCYKRGCSGTSCYSTGWTHDEAVQSCPTGTSYQYRCSGQYRQLRTVTKGCYSNSCTTNYSGWSTIQSCGSGSYNSCSGWSYYCSGNSVYRKRTCYTRGCSGSSCYSKGWTNSQKVQTCSTGYQCSGSSCKCGPWPHYKMKNGKCVPSCGGLLAKKGLPDIGKGCCKGGCWGTTAGGPGATHDCNYCCSNAYGQWLVCK